MDVLSLFKELGQSFSFGEIRMNFIFNLEGVLLKNSAPSSGKKCFLNLTDDAN